jgi:hypothetical protein
MSDPSLRHQYFKFIPLKVPLPNKVIGIIRVVTRKAASPHQNGLIFSGSLRSISVYLRKSINSLLANDGLTMAVPLVVISVWVLSR